MSQSTDHPRLPGSLPLPAGLRVITLGRMVRPLALRGANDNRAPASRGAPAARLAAAIVRYGWLWIGLAAAGGTLALR